MDNMVAHASSAFVPRLHRFLNITSSHRDVISLSRARFVEVEIFVWNCMNARQAAGISAKAGLALAISEKGFIQALMDRLGRENREQPLRFTKDLGGPLKTHTS